MKSDFTNFFYFALFFRIFIPLQHYQVGMDCNRDRLQLSGLSLEHEPLNQEDDRKESFKVHKDVDRRDDGYQQQME